MSFEYLGILGLLLVVALTLKFKFKIKVFNSPKEAVILYRILIILGTIWDYIAITRGHWFYPGKGTMGIFIGVIPIEDYLFAFVCPYFLLILYKVISKQVK